MAAGIPLKRAKNPVTPLHLLIMNHLRLSDPLHRVPFCHNWGLFWC
jgi:hypothetical protein